MVTLLHDTSNASIPVRLADTERGRFPALQIKPNPPSMNSLRKALLTVSAATLLASSASAVVLTLTPTADTHLRANTPTTTNGSTTELWIGQLNTTQAFHSVLSFDLSTVPVDATINSVSLVMRQSSEDGSSSIAVMTVDLYALTQSFSEAQASWNLASTGNSWTTAGGSFGATLLSSASVNTRPSQQASSLGDKTWASTSSFVASVQNAADTTNSIGFLFKDANETNGAANNRELVKFFSREGTVAPQLIIDYSVSSVPEPSTYAALMGVAALAGCALRRRRAS